MFIETDIEQKDNSLSETTLYIVQQTEELLFF